MVGFNASKVPSGKKFSGPKQEPLEAGTYPARLAWLILAGVQEQRPFQNQEKAPALEMILGYEFLDEFCTDEQGNIDETQPRLLSETFPFHSLESEKARSTRRYTSLDPEKTFGGDWEKLVGTPLNVTITARPSKTDASKVYNNVAEISKMRSRDADKWEGKGVLDFRVFNIYEPDLETFRVLPAWVQDKIKAAVDFPSSPLKGMLSDNAQTADENTESSKKEERDSAW